MNKTILYIIILILAAGLSFFLGAFFLGPKLTLNTGSQVKTAEEAAAEEIVVDEITQDQTDDIDSSAQETSPQDIFVRRKGAAASFFFPDIDSEKGLQNLLTVKSNEISGIRTVLNTAGGVFNVIQAAHPGNGEFLAPVDSTVNKVSGMLLSASGVIAFEKHLLFAAGHVILIVFIPVYIIISVILMIINRDKKKNKKLLIKTILFSLIIIFILPVSFHLAALADKTVMSHNSSPLIASITEKGILAQDMEDEITALRKQNKPVLGFMQDAETLGFGLADNALNYFMIFIIIYAVIPVLIITAVICLAVLFKKRLLSDDRE